MLTFTALLILGFMSFVLIRTWDKQRKRDLARKARRDNKVVNLDEFERKIS